MFTLFCADERLIGGITLAAVVLIAVALLFIIGNNRKNDTRVLAYGAICVALSFGLSYIKIPISFLGGSITLASMVPLLLFSYCFGIGKGLMVGMIYGLLQFVQNPYFLTPVQFIFDYLLAFSALGLCGVIRRMKSARASLIVGTLIATVTRFLCHIIAGVVYFEAGWVEASLPIFGDTAGLSAFVYSTAYNAVYMLPEIIITTAVIAALAASKSFLRVLPKSTLTLKCADKQKGDK